MPQEVIIRMSAQDAELARAWLRGKQGIGQMGAEMDKFRGKTQAAGKDATGMATSIGMAAARFAGVASATAAIAKAAQLVKAEYDGLVARQQKAGDFQISLAQSQRALVRNLGPADLTPTQAVEAAAQIAKATGADVGAVSQAASGVLSARGRFEASQAIGQLGAVAKIDPSMAASDLQTLSGASLDIRKAFGGNAEQAIGAILSSQRTARVEDTGQFARNLVPALIGLKNFGDDFKESSAMVAAITQESADVEGARSGTAAIQFAKQVNEATSSIQSLLGKGTAARVDYLLTKEGDELRQALVGSFDEQIASAGVDERGGLTGEAKQFTALKGLLIEGSSARASYLDALRQTPTIAEAGSEYQMNIDAQGQIGSLRNARINEQFRGGYQNILQDEGMGRAGVIHQRVNELIDQAPQGGFLPTAASYVDAAERFLDVGVFGRRTSEQGDARLLRQQLGRTTEPNSPAAIEMRKMLEVLERIERNSADKNVRVENTDAPARERARATPASSPVMALNTR